MIVIAVVVLVFFGPRKLPELGRQMGKALAEFRRASTEIRRVVNEEIAELERGESRDVTREAQVVVTPPQEPVGTGSLAPPGLERSLEKPPEENPSDGAPEKA